MWHTAGVVRVVHDPPLVGGVVVLLHEWIHAPGDAGAAVLGVDEQAGVVSVDVDETGRGAVGDELLGVQLGELPHVVLGVVPGAGRGAVLGAALGAALGTAVVGLHHQVLGAWGRKLISEEIWS